MKRSERHHLKQDEFVHWVDRVLTWALDNQRQIINAGLVVLGAVLLLSGLYIYRQRQAEVARGLLNEALRQYHGVVRSGTGAEASSDVPVFDSEEDKYRAAREAFERVAEDYGSYDEGRQARYYLGLCQERLSELDAAEASLQAVREGKRDLLYYLASQSLASVKAEKGDEAGAADLYRSLIEDADNPLPKDYLLFELAKVEERAGRLEEARQTYERLLLEHPDSQFRGDAMMRSEKLALAAKRGTSTSG